MKYFQTCQWHTIVTKAIIKAGDYRYSLTKTPPCCTVFNAKQSRYDWDDSRRQCGLFYCLVYTFNWWRHRQHIFLSWYNFMWCDLVKFSVTGPVLVLKIYLICNPESQRYLELTTPGLIPHLLHYPLTSDTSYRACPAFVPLLRSYYDPTQLAFLAKYVLPCGLCSN